MWTVVCYWAELNICLIIIQLLVWFISSSVFKNWIQESNQTTSIFNWFSSILDLNHKNWFFQFIMVWIVGSIGYFLSTYTPRRVQIQSHLSATLTCKRPSTNKRQHSSTKASSQAKRRWRQLHPPLLLPNINLFISAINTLCSDKAKNLPNLTIWDPLLTSHPS
jgi:hypothetical protein